MKSIYIIAEAGVNHNGSLDLALQMVDAAAEAGIDAVKFQTFKAEKIVCRNAPKAQYQTKTTDALESQFEMLSRLELEPSAYQKLNNYCVKKGVDFLSTPFDLESLDLLVNKLDLNKIKISSGDITNAPMLLQVALSGKDAILSTGMSSLGDIEEALAVMAFGYLDHKTSPSYDEFFKAYQSKAGKEILNKKVTLLHCTTGYPTPFKDVNLRAINTLRVAFGLPVGYSDHTQGISISIAAAALGAAVIEKHFTLDRTLSGPDHLASLEPGELKTMVEAIRQVEEAMGDALKRPSPSEINNMSVARKSLVAAKPIKQGELFSDENLTTKRPGSGVSPAKYWEYLGRPAEKDYDQDEVIMV